MSAKRQLPVEARIAAGSFAQITDVFDNSAPETGQQD